MMNQCKTGRKAERVAADYLRARGYRIWKTNWRWGKRELDLVTLYRNELVIVEVKSRVGNPVNALGGGGSGQATKYHPGRRCLYPTP